MPRKREDLTGKVYGRLTVVSYAKNSNDSISTPGKPMWNCACFCGNKKVVRASDLKSGDCNSCGCLAKENVLAVSSKLKSRRDDYIPTDLIGKIYGNLEVLSFSHFKYTEKTKLQNWLCKCTCGNSRIITRSYLMSKATVSCESCANKIKIDKVRKFRKGGVDQPIKNLYNQYKCKCASVRNLDFFLSFEEFKNLIKSNCYYCDNPPLQRFCIKRKKKEYVNELEDCVLYNGIDRVNNDLGYTLDNCVTCCTQCNTMKLDYTIIEFIDKVKKIYNKLIKKNV